ncbi:MAG TPA: tRNA pseudouridine(55) synthase TruB [Pirellulales bacterium]|nr:tRNA pseudouridine(55) synthase TruB [Pirellulales bacterium]
MHGLLNINKPTGITSRAAVDRVARLVRGSKVGHAGTLDPLASGVLVIAFGAATRLIEYVQRMPKQYRGTFLLGRHSPTEDIEGDITVDPNPLVPAAEALLAAAARLTGDILQRPPAYSALKVQGRRAYDLARRGQPVALEPRPIHVYSLAVSRYEYPEITLDIACSGGTYIRSLGRDLAELVGTTAVMSALVRTSIGSFRIGESVLLDDLDAARLQQSLLPSSSALSDLPPLELSEAEAIEISHGRFLDRTDLPDGNEFAAMDASGRVLAILVRRDDGRLGPRVNLSTL